MGSKKLAYGTQSAICMGTRILFARVSLLRTCYKLGATEAMVDRELALLFGLTTEVMAGRWWAMTQMHSSVALRCRQPVTGDRAAGYGVSGTIAAVLECQPLAADGLWRVTLAGETIGRLIRQDEQAFQNGESGWVLLQVDDLSDAQLAAYDAAMVRPGWASGP